MVESQKWLTVPYSFETNDMKYFRAPGYASPQDFVRHLKAAFDCLYEEGAYEPKMMSVGLHLRYSGTAAGVTAVDEFIEYAKAFPRVWFARRIDIARWWSERYADLPGFVA